MGAARNWGTEREMEVWRCPSGIMLSGRWHWRWRWVVLDQVAMRDQACTPHSAKAPPGRTIELFHHPEM